MTNTTSDWLNQERVRLSTDIIDAPTHLRIMVVGRKVNGSTDIVACLERALRNLGHHVMFFDQKKHPKITDNPYRAQGGNGPIYLRLDDIRSAVLRFRPQMMICLAGGLALREEDAAWLKAQGVVTVGITLSDPDVFDSVQSFAGNFDVHTSNALTAVDMYKDSGIQNTLHFPFGVDRSFVTQQVAVAERFQADVICLGHATAHPLRDGLMSAVHDRLGDRFRVKAYGRGWSLPDSRPVEGLDVLQASRGGLIHVNFPMTRAGFTNVKCGVFETIAAGGVLVTQRFDEMALFFDYDSEIGGYRTFEDLPEVVEGLLSDKAALDHMRRTAFSKLVTQHLYEHRWLKLFDDILTLARRAPGWMGADRAGQIEQALTEDAGRARMIALSGFYGARNLGDDLIMESIAGSIERQVKGAQVAIVAQSPGTVELAFGRQAVARTRHHEVDALVAKSDAFVLGGGGLWHDYTFRKAGGIRSLATGATMSIGGVGIAGMLANIRGIPFHVVGLGVGPLTDPEAGQLVRYVAKMTDSLMVRDTGSLDLLKWAGVPENRVSVDPDVVYALDLAGEASAELAALSDTHFVLGLNLRPWDRGDVPISALIDQIAQSVRSFAAGLDKPLALVLLPMQEGASYDRAVLAQLATVLAGAYPVVELPTPLVEHDFIGALKKIDLLLSMRLHSCLLAHRLGTPAVGLAYDPKLRAHFQEVGRADLAVDLDIPAADLAALMQRAAFKMDANDLAAKVADLTTRARQGLSRVAAQIEASPRRVIVWGVEEGPVAHEHVKAEAAPVAAKSEDSENDQQSDAAKRQGLSGRSRAMFMAQSTSASSTGSRMPNLPLVSTAPDASGTQPSVNLWSQAIGLDARENGTLRPPPVALSRDPAQEIADWLQLAAVANEAGDPETALELLFKVRQRDPNNAPAILAMLDIHFKQQSWSKLTFYIEKGMTLPSVVPEATRARFRMYLARGRRDLAQQVVDKLPADSPLAKDLLQELTKT